MIMYKEVLNELKDKKGNRIGFEQVRVELTDKETASRLVISEEDVLARLKRQKTFELLNELSTRLLALDPDLDIATIKVVSLMSANIDLNPPLQAGVDLYQSYKIEHLKIDSLDRKSLEAYDVTKAL